MKRSTNPIVLWFNSFRAVHKLLFSLGLGLLTFLVLLWYHFQLLTGIMIGWDTFSLCLITLSWLTFVSTDSKQICLQASKQDESRYAIFLIVIASVCISLVAILFVLKNNDKDLVNKSLHTIFSMLGVALSWFLLHTTLTLRYAHLYYVQSLSKEHANKGGLDFPAKHIEPDYLDFAYFAFVIGMTFQVSDVEVSSTNIRRVVLLHSLISFIFNTIIVALTISILANLNN
jgi:uncharacterized membrane protein